MIGVWMTGAEITSLSSTIASGRPTFSVVAWPKRCAPRMLKRKLTIGSFVRLSKAGCASVRSPPSTMTRRSTGTRWPPASFEGSRSTSAAPCCGEHAEFELRGPAEDILQTLRVLQARHLDEDAVGALALDVGLGRAERVDAPAQDLDRLVDGPADLLVDRRRPYR